ncbi:response regulator transcription factor [Asticcacaulis sp. BYS171W]|uniref:Response regulator transcription factor n=1 Tax=Asticcacaulis aquaticus TaxID=2984212 RepID=A0ABT5HX44_9CAUL|nr:response regulator transcription factor [Asticcacaulis aquaticus]MDC7684628.1 response regulator transcription factor [Asticcacaulis aquaticus]
MTTPTPSAHLLLIEDEADSARIIRETLEPEGFVVTWCTDGEKGLSEAGETAYDLIVLDRMLPGISGIEVLAQLRQAGVATPVLMLSALSRSENRVDGLEGGADDYLGKPFDAHELIARVKALLRRSKNQVHTAVMLFGDLELHVKSRTAYRAGKHLALSPKEYDILKLLMDHAGDTVTRDMLLQKVWKLNFDPQTNVIDVNMSRLRNRLEEGFTQPVLETVRGAGFRLLRVQTPKAG